MDYGARNVNSKWNSEWKKFSFFSRRLYSLLCDCTEVIRFRVRLMEVMVSARCGIATVGKENFGLYILRITVGFPIMRKSYSTGFLRV